MHDDIADPRTVAAIALARRSHVAAEAEARAEGGWLSARDEGEVDEGEEALGLAQTALTHLEAGRWDEARACADEALELAEGCGYGAGAWRRFALLVEEAAETGRSR